MGLRNPQTTLDYYYAIENAAVVALANPQAEIVKYTLDGRSVEIRTFADLEKLRHLIARLESIIVASTPVVADFSGAA